MTGTWGPFAHLAPPAWSRRRWLGWAAGGVATALGHSTAGAQTTGEPPVRWLADMHSHYGMFLPRLFGLDLRQHMMETGTALLAWSATDDHRWIALTPSGWRQYRTPEPGALWTSFQDRLAGYQAQLAKWKLPRVLNARDVDAAMAGTPHVLLATEGANFLEGEPGRVLQARDWGVRHLQLVHFIQSPLGDHQTAHPAHGGLTALGAQVVRECQRLGLVIDMAHGTAALVDGVLDTCDAVPLWSHSWISSQGGTHTSPGWIARSLSPATARKIAARGGAVGLWSVRVLDLNYPLKGVPSYADEIVRMCDLIGPEHVAFGTDMEGAGSGPVLSNYRDLREVANLLVQRGMNESEIAGVLIGNYARILKLAMNGAQA